MPQHRRPSDRSPIRPAAAVSFAPEARSLGLGPADEALIGAVLLATRVLVSIAARSLNASPHDITLPQYRALVLLASRGPGAPSALASELAAAPSSITRLCDRLVRKGLIARTPDMASRRQVVLSISPAGREVVDAVTTARRSEIARVVRGVPAARREAVIQALNELGAAAGEMPDDAWLLGWEE